MPDSPWVPPGQPPTRPSEPPPSEPHAGPQWGNGPLLPTPSEPPLTAPVQRAAARTRFRWIIPAVVGVLVLVALVVVGSMKVNDFLASVDAEPSDHDESGLGGAADPAVPEEPPSERGALPTTSLPEVREPGGAGTAAGADRFRELDCEFTGEALIEPALSLDDLSAEGHHDMRLQPGASFDCRDGDERSAGSIELDATFPALSALSGVGSGPGRIAWSEVAPSARTELSGAPESSTGVEIELTFPVIVVWTTILDGPYAGFHGRLVLVDWELIEEDGGIVGVRFARTAATFAPT